MSNVIKKYALFWHLLFWLLYLVLLTMIFARFLGFEQALLRNVLNGLVLAPLVYFNLYFLVYRYLFREQYAAYAVIIIGLIAVTAPLRTWIDARFSEMETSPFAMYSVAHYGTIILSSVIMLGITTTLQLLEEWYDKKEIENDLMRYQLEAELKFLKAQVNPHFLFNVLNNIYSLTYLEGKAAAPHILKLSELMRYMLYESDDTVVELEKELGYIRNYLELQSLKNSGTADIQFTITGDTGKMKIAPLLFIPFFENAFKHGNMLDAGSGCLHASLAISENTIFFHIENTIAATDTRKDKTGGIGLENVSRRLKLLYPDKHSIKMERSGPLFIVHLEIITT